MPSITVQTRKLWTLALLLANYSCSSDPLSSSWEPEAPVSLITESPHQCMTMIQSYTRGDTLALSWHSESMGLTYQYSITLRRTEHNTPEAFVLQDPFGKTFRINADLDSLRCGNKDTDFCLLFPLPIDESPHIALQLRWNGRRLSRLEAPSLKGLTISYLEGELYPKNYLKMDIQQRFQALKEDREKGKVTPNRARRAFLDGLQCPL